MLAAVVLATLAAGIEEPRFVRPLDGDAPGLRRALEAAGIRVTHLLGDGRLVVPAPILAPELRARLAEDRPVPAAAGFEGAGQPLLHGDAEVVAARDASAGAAGSSSALLAGDVAVGLVLPESTGEREPSLTDWSAADVERAVATVVAGTMRFALAPGAPRLTFLVELLASPPAGAAAGTVACAYEAHRHTNFDAFTDSSWLAALGYPGEVVESRARLAADLRARLGADAVYLVKVVNDRGATPGRATAMLGGPQATWFLSSPPYVAAHETGHVFGALDEYCPDACRSPSQLGGTLRAANANSRGNDGTGWNAGQGEGLACLMMGDTLRICPHTRAQLGWDDADRDGELDAEQVQARTTLTAYEPDGDALLVRGRSALVAPYGLVGVSLTRIAAVEVRVAGSAWVEAEPEDGGFDAAEESFLARLPALPAGRYRLEARARTAAGTVERVPAFADLESDGANADDAAPFAVLAARPQAARAGTTVRFDASASSDLEGSPLEARFDFDGDGAFDTAWGALVAEHAFERPDTYRAVAEVRDRSGRTSRGGRSVLAAAGDLAPVLVLGVTPGAAYGEPSVRIVADASASFDPEGGPLTFDFEFGAGGPRLAGRAEPVASAEVAVAMSEAVTVTVVARDREGNESELTRIVRVVSYDHPPAAVLTLAPGPGAGEWTLDARASTDPDSLAPWDRMLLCRFDFEGDGVFDTAFAADGCTAIHAYPDGQAHAPLVEVRDRLLATSRATAELDRRSAPRFASGPGLAAEPLACGVSLSWRPAESGGVPLTYTVYRMDLADETSDWVPIASTPFARLLDRTALPGRDYAWHVRAVAPGEPPFEDDNQETVVARREAEPLVLRAVRRAGEAALSWDIGRAARILVATDKAGAWSARAEDPGPVLGGQLLTLYRLEADCSRAELDAAGL